MPVSRRHFLMGSTAVITAAAVAGSPTPPPAKSGRSWRLPEKRPFRTIENEGITLKDGTRLAARMWIPVHADVSPVAVVWESLPYRKRDMERQRDTGWAEAF